jgi:hypothetical protein
MFRKAMIGGACILASIFLDGRQPLYPRLVVRLDLSEPPTNCFGLTRWRENAARQAASVRMHRECGLRQSLTRFTGSITYCD